MRGYSLVVHHVVGRHTVSPVYAGVFPTPPDAAEPNASCPRVRGGIPGAHFGHTARAPLSPCTRGYSHGKAYRKRHDGVVPVYAVVFPTLHRFFPRQLRCPRVRGGIPAPPICPPVTSKLSTCTRGIPRSQSRGGRANELSPYTRGYSRIAGPILLPSLVLTVYAGVFPG